MLSFIAITMLFILRFVTLVVKKNDIGQNLFALIAIMMHFNG